LGSVDSAEANRNGEEEGMIRQKKQQVLTEHFYHSRAEGRFTSAASVVNPRRGSNSRARQEKSVAQFRNSPGEPMIELLSIPG
jgi:hypothetical protein